MSRRLSGKTILITGASAGMGRSTALEFARTAPDCRLILAARREPSLLQLKSTIESETNKTCQVLVWKMDVSKPEEVEGLLERLPEGWRNVDVLVNNAGLVKGMETVGSIPPADILTMINTNVLGLISLTQEILRSYLSRGGHGDIINVGSIAGREGYQGGSIYCATKAAVRTFTEALRKELVHTRVRVMEIDPGQVETEFSIVRFRGDVEKANQVYAGCEPLTPDDIAEIIVFMAGRRENVVVAETMIYPNHQASAAVIYRRPT